MKIKTTLDIIKSEIGFKPQSIISIEFGISRDESKTLNDKWVSVKDIIKEMDDYVEAYNGKIDQDAIDILWALKNKLGAYDNLKLKLLK